MNHLTGKLGALALMATMFMACSTDDDLFDIRPDGSAPKITLSGEIEQVYNSRVNDNGFCNGDKVGIYVVDYEGTAPGKLNATGNTADNVGHTYDESAGKWNAAYDIFFRDDKTNVDIYGYYPFANPSDMEAYAFELKKDQSTAAADGLPGGYEASDFLWAKATNIAPTDKVIRLPFRHIMASARVTLAEGTGFAEGEWATVEKQVLMMNTTRTSTINLSTGAVTATGDVPNTGTIPYEQNGDFRSIIVPQTVAAGKVVALITVGGMPYQFKKNEAMEYVASKQHNFTITVNKRVGSGYEFVLTSESITAWENDGVSHDASAREYVVIDVPEPGTLADCIKAAGKDLTQIKNLKLTGKITASDFYTMKADMPRLSALNLSEVEIKAGEGVYVSGTNVRPNVSSCVDNEIPGNAMSGRESLTSLVLPQKITKISEEAFYGCKNIGGSLIIPEGVAEIGRHAFCDCTGFSGMLSLPSTLSRIGEKAFMNCGFICELQIPDKLVEIEGDAFYHCTGFYGVLKLPESLKSLGEATFNNCGFRGDLTIPQSISEIPAQCFYGCGFDGILTLHDGITEIGESAFAHTSFRGELNLPKIIEVISDYAFSRCNFSGKLVLPDGIVRIGSGAFADCARLTGILEFPQAMLSIGEEAFRGCGQIEGIKFPKDIDAIGRNSFQDCFQIGSIVCEGAVPPVVQTGAFDGVPKDNFTLEVPESAVSTYQTTAGWSDFKRIAAHRELVCRPSLATAINTRVTRDLVLNAESDWEVESMPDWVSLDRNSGSGKTELKLTFAEMPRSAGNREGEIVFRLKDKDYTTRCSLTQYDYEYAEDEIVTLQSATQGRGVNLVFLGDGYSAKDISEGKMMDDIREGVEHFFNIEPYKTYRNYFNVYTGIAVSPESGIGGVNTIVYNRFNTTAKGGVKLGGRNTDGSDEAAIFSYACKAPTVSESNLGETLVVMIANTKEYGGIAKLYDDGSAIAYCPLSDADYPSDFRGIIQHEAGGHGFAKLGDEYIYHNAFLDACECSDCNHQGIAIAKGKGWFANLSTTGKMDAVPWSHFIFHEKYSQVVDIYEGGYMHARGVYRSEQNSCMNNNIPYHSAISRETIVKRIKAIAGETYSFDDFVAHDVMDASTVVSRSFVPLAGSRPSNHHAPEFMGRRPRVKKI